MEYWKIMFSSSVSFFTKKNFFLILHKTNKKMFIYVMGNINLPIITVYCWTTHLNNSKRRLKWITSNFRVLFWIVINLSYISVYSNSWINIYKLSSHLNTFMIAVIKNSYSVIMVFIRIVNSLFHLIMVNISRQFINY